jgi:hypothetical protein
VQWVREVSTLAFEQIMELVVAVRKHKKADTHPNNEQTEVELLARSRAKEEFAKHKQSVEDTQQS